MLQVNLFILLTKISIGCGTYDETLNLKRRKMIESKRAFEVSEMRMLIVVTKNSSDFLGLTSLRH